MNHDEGHEVFRGHFEECFQHLADRIFVFAPKGTRRVAPITTPIAEFCGVAIRSVSRWLYTSERPVGEVYIKLIYYLDLAGYKLIELERMPKAKRNFAELIGFGIWSSKQAAEFLGYADPSTFYDVLWGRYGMREEKEQKMWEAWKARKEELETAKKKAYERCRPDVPLKDSLRRPEPVAATARSATVPPARRAQAAMSIMEGLLVLLEEGSFGTSADVPQQLVNTMLRLSARLSELGSRLVNRPTERR